MLITAKKGNIKDRDLSDNIIDRIELEWYEVNKRVQTKYSVKGRELALKFLDAAPDFTQGDILYEQEKELIVIEILPCDCLIIKPSSIFETASAAYEVGNKHLPLFFEDGSLLVPFEMPLYRLLVAQGYQVDRDNRRLLTALKTTVTPHDSNVAGSLFSRIMQLTK